MWCCWHNCFVADCLGLIKSRRNNIPPLYKGLLPLREPCFLFNNFFFSFSSIKNNKKIIFRWKGKYNKNTHLLCFSSTKIFQLCVCVWRRIWNRDKAGKFSRTMVRSTPPRNNKKKKIKKNEIKKLKGNNRPWPLWDEQNISKTFSLVLL